MIFRIGGLQGISIFLNSFQGLVQVFFQVAEDIYRILHGFTMQLIGISFRSSPHIVVILLAFSQNLVGLVFRSFYHFFLAYQAVSFSLAKSTIRLPSA